MSSPKTTSARVAALRERRAAIGVTRLELYAHPEDHAALKALAGKLSRRRARASAENDSPTRHSRKTEENE